MKKVLSVMLALSLVIIAFAGCASSTTTTTATTATTTTAATTTEAATTEATTTTGAAEEPMYIGVVSKGFQHAFWQAVLAGAEAAETDLGVDMYFTGPEGESAIGDQVNMLSAELAKNPSAIALAALDTNSVLQQLAEAQSKNIPIVGFDSGVPDAPAGQIAANASTNNDNAAALGAEKMFEALEAQITAATADSPVRICILSQDVTSASIQGRTRGFAVKMAELAGGVNESVAITGGYEAINTGDAGAAVVIEVIVGSTPDITDMTNAANGLLNGENLIGVFLSNEGAVSGFLAAVNAGSTIPEGVKVVGFDAGSGQKAAVRNGTFMGSVTQDPFQIGYKAVELAVMAARGEAVSDVDTGAKWYDASNIDDPDIALLVYD